MSDELEGLRAELARAQADSARQKEEISEFTKQTARLTEELEKIRSELAGERANSARQKEEIARLTGEVGRRTKELETERIALNRDRAKLDERERKIRERELNAEADFAQQFSKQAEESTRALTSRIEMLKRQIKDFEKTQLDTERRLNEREVEFGRKLEEREREFEKKLQARDEEAHAKLAAELARRRDLADHEIAVLERSAAAARQRQIESLEVSRKQLGDMAQSLQQQWTQEMESGRQELARLRKELQDSLLRQLTEEQGHAAQNAAEIREKQAALRDILNKTQDKLVQSEADNARLQELLNESNKKYDAARRHWDALGRGPEEALELIENQKNRIEEMERERTQFVTEAEAKRIRGLADEFAALSARADVLATENSQLRKEREYEQGLGDEYDLIQWRNENLRSQIDVLKKLYADLDGEYNKLLDRTRQQAEHNQRIAKDSAEYARRRGDIIFEWRRTPAASESEISEIEWLSGIQDKIEESGLHYPMRILKSFHTCLKIANWSPLTILSGVSGTGKSELPRLYARFGGLHFESIAVQPNWDSPQDVFGFYNYMENKFSARPLLQAMARCQLPLDKGGYDSQILLVLLDEMNLARVELYLSDLLSKWELRRGEDRVYLEIDLGPNCDTYPVRIGENMIFVGTVNEDETTQGLSDKVLDRGNLLYFPRPNSLRSRTSLDLAPRARPWSFARWTGWRMPPATEEDEPELYGRIQELGKSMERINEHLSRVERAIGHRVWQAVELYICNHPDVCANLDNAGELPEKVRMAFEDQIVQRVIPKLRGLALEGAAARALNGIGAEIEQHAGGLVGDYQAALRASDRGFVWRQSEYLEAMAE